MSMLQVLEEEEKNKRKKKKNKAVYTVESVACDWAGAVMQKLPENAKKNKCVTD